jgi:hypothetical protein
MKISDALPQIRTGDVLLFRGRSLFAWLIKARTRSVYSHAGVVQRIRTNGHSRVWVVEALEPFGVRAFPLERYVALGEEIDWFVLDDPTIDPEKVADYAMDQVGKKYSVAGVWWSFSWVARAVQAVFRLHRVTRRLANAKSWFCSELVAAALRHAGFKSDEGLVPLETDPGAVARFTCLRRKGTLEI